MNLGVDREAMVRDVLVGYGRPASTPVAEVYGAAYNAERGVPRSTRPGQRRCSMPPAGAPAPSGSAKRTVRELIRAAVQRPGHAAARYRGGLRRGDETARHRHPAARHQLGRDRHPLRRLRGAARRRRDALQHRLAGLRHPAHPGARLVAVLEPRQLHRGRARRSAERARPSPPGPAKDELYRQIQAVYVAEPSQVFLVFLDHAYGYRDLGWNQSAPILEPHSHGVAWGPWWNLAAWTR